MSTATSSTEAGPELKAAAVTRVRSDVPFLICLGLLSGVYVFLVVAMLVADASFTTPDKLWASLQSPEIRYAIWLSLISCSLTMVLSLWVAVPIGYVMSRYRFRGKALIDAILDVPIVLPPLVVGLSLLILFRFRPFAWISPWVVYEIPSIILAQFMVACAFAVRTMRATFAQINPRHEQVAMTLGCSRGQAFWMVVLPSARQGILTAATLAWARSLGEFGPILVFSGATRLRTEVLPTTVFLELQAGNLEGALAVSLVMVLAAVVVLVLVRMFGQPGILAPAE